MAKKTINRDAPTRQALQTTNPRKKMATTDRTTSKSREIHIEVTFKGLYTAYNPEQLPGYIEIQK